MGSELFRKGFEMFREGFALFGIWCILKGSGGFGEFC
jgi:hypothetical protein